MAGTLTTQVHSAFSGAIVDVKKSLREFLVQTRFDRFHGNGEAPPLWTEETGSLLDEQNRTFGIWATADVLIALIHSRDSIFDPDEKEKLGQLIDESVSELELLWSKHKARHHSYLKKIAEEIHGKRNAWRGGGEHTRTDSRLYGSYMAVLRAAIKQTESYYGLPRISTAYKCCLAADAEAPDTGRANLLTTVAVHRALRLARTHPKSPGFVGSAFWGRGIALHELRKWTKNQEKGADVPVDAYNGSHNNIKATDNWGSSDDLAQTIRAVDGEEGVFESDETYGVGAFRKVEVAHGQESKAGAVLEPFRSESAVELLTTWSCLAESVYVVDEPNDDIKAVLKSVITSTIREFRSPIVGLNYGRHCRVLNEISEFRQGLVEASEPDAEQWKAVRDSSLERVKQLESWGYGRLLARGLFDYYWSDDTPEDDMPTILVSGNAIEEWPPGDISYFIWALSRAASDEIPLDKASIHAALGDLIGDAGAAELNEKDEDVVWRRVLDATSLWELQLLRESPPPPSLRSVLNPKAPLLLGALGVLFGRMLEPTSFGDWTRDLKDGGECLRSGILRPGIKKNNPGRYHGVYIYGVAKALIALGRLTSTEDRRNEELRKRLMDQATAADGQDENARVAKAQRDLGSLNRAESIARGIAVCFGGAIAVSVLTSTLVTIHADSITKTVKLVLYAQSASMFLGTIVGLHVLTNRFARAADHHCYDDLEYRSGKWWITIDNDNKEVGDGSKMHLIEACKNANEKPLGLIGWILLSVLISVLAAIGTTIVEKNI